MNIIGSAEHYGQFVNLMRARVHALNISYDALGEICGFAEGYTNSVLCGNKVMSVYSLFTITKALGLDLCFHHDAVDLAKLKARTDWIGIRRPGPRFRGELGGIVHFNNNLNFYRKIGRKGAKAAHANALKKRALSETRRKAAQARWRKNEPTDASDV